MREVQRLSDRRRCRTKVRADHYEALVGLNIRQKPQLSQVRVRAHPIVRLNGNFCRKIMALVVQSRGTLFGRGAGNRSAQFCF